MKQFILAFAVATAVLFLYPTQTTYTAPTEPEVIDDRALRIDSYFEKRGMPLAGYSKAFLTAADKYGIDWRLLPAISVRESSGGKQMCGNNPFGWGSCKLNNFSNIEEAIDTVSRNLGGHNPRTASYYSGNTYQKLWSYNGTVMPSYPDEVIAIMGQF